MHDQSLSELTIEAPLSPASEGSPPPVVTGFVHISMVGSWRATLSAHLAKICRSGLFERTARLYVVMTDNTNSEVFGRHGKVEFITCSNNSSDSRIPVMEQVRQFCLQNEGLIYFLGAEDISRNDPVLPDWRSCREYFAIDCYEDCILALETNDICGVDWYDQTVSRYPGDVFWARADYVRELDPVAFAATGTGDATSCQNVEHWIRSKENVREAYLHRGSVHMHSQSYPRSLYAQDRTDTNRMSPSRHTSVSESQLRLDSDKPVYGFMHVAMKAHWRSIIAEQIIKLKASGLWERTQRIFVGLLGPDRTAFDFCDPKFEVMFYDSSYEAAELPTLTALQQFCGSNDCLVYYAHTKGVFQQGQGQEDWRRCMEHFAFTRYQDCILGLSDHDVCGINWSKTGWCNRFAGNFWWARSDYIRKLPDVRRLELLPGLDASPRHICERWIGENPSVRAACLHDTYTNHYLQTYPRSRYAQLPEITLDQRFRPSAWSGLENQFQNLLEPVEPIQRIVDIGVEWGLSMMCFASCIPQATVIGVDPYQAAPFELRARSATLGMQGIIGATEAENWVTQHLPSFPNAMLLKTTSANAAAIVAGQVDVVHIDALHTYNDVADDFACWEPKLRPGGCILFHDIESFPRDVGKLFNELPGRKASIRECHGLGAWYKPGPSSHSRAPQRKRFG